MIDTHISKGGTPCAHAESLQHILAMATDDYESEIIDKFSICLQWLPSPCCNSDGSEKEALKNIREVFCELQWRWQYLRQAPYHLAKLVEIIDGVKDS